MFKMDYQGYYKRSVMNTLIGCIVWSGLSTYVIISKGQIGESSIPIFESIIFLASIATSKYIAKNKINYAKALSLDIAIEFVCLVVILFITIVKGVAIESAIALYILIILTSGVTNIVTSESQRDIEDKRMKSDTSKKFLKICRARHRDYRLYGLTTGAILSLLLLTYFQIELKYYAILLLSLNIMQVVYDSYLVKKYLLIRK